MQVAHASPGTVFKMQSRGEMDGGVLSGDVEEEIMRAKSDPPCSLVRPHIKSVSAE